MEKLIEFKEKWQSQYPSAVKSWEDNWDILSTFFAYPVEIRKIIYTTNIIEGLNRQFRKVTKTKSVFPNDDSLRKMLYLTSQNITKKWTQRYKNWDIVIRQLEIMHDEKTAQTVALPPNPRGLTHWFSLKRAKRADEPPVSVQNPHDRSGCSSALPYPVKR